jgi:excisionase family DNA binding protein
MGKKLDTHAAARRLGLCVETVRRLIRRGILPAVKKGRYRWEIDEDRLNDIFTSQADATPADTIRLPAIHC